MKCKQVLALSVVLVLAGGLWAAEPGNPRAARTGSPPSGQTQPAWQAELSAKLPEWTAATLDPVQKAGARDAMHAIVEAIYQPLAAPVDPADLEVRLRLAEIQKDLLDMARLKKVLASLPPGRRKDVLSFAAGNRAGFASFFEVSPSPFGPNMNAVAAYGMAVPSMLPVTDGRPENETVLIACLLYGDPQMARSAAELVCGSDLRSPEMADALTRAVVCPIMGDMYPDPSRYPYAYAMGDPWGSCLAALVGIGNKRTGPPLLAALLKDKPLSLTTYNLDMHIAEAISSLGDKKMLPLLMERIDQLSRHATTMSVGGAAVEIRQVDPLIECAFRLANLGQATSRVVAGNMSMPAFKSGQDRVDTLAKLHDWWEKNRAAFAASQPYAVPDMAQWQRQGRLGATGQAATAASKRPFDAAQVKALAARVRQACQVAVKDFGHEHGVRRQDAQRTPLEAYETYLDALVECTDRPESAELADMLLDRAVAESEFQAMLPGLAEDMRQKMSQCRKAFGEAFDEVLAIERVRRLVGIRKLAALDDPKHVCEPLLVYCLRHPSYDVAAAAIEAAASGKYKSDEVCDALAQVVLGNDPRYFNWANVYFQPTQSWPPVNALKALAAIKSPRALAAIVSGLSTGQNFDQFQLVAMSDALVEAGDKSVIASLMAMQDRKRGLNPGWVLPDKSKMTSSEGDAALVTVIRLLGQEAADYRMTHYDQALGTGQPSPRIYGFKKEEDRAWALEKMRLWWDQNKDSPPYSAFAPLPPPPKVTRPAQPQPSYGVPNLVN